MPIRMLQTVKTANGSYEGGDTITGLSPVLEAQLIDGGSAIWVPSAKVVYSGVWGPIPAGFIAQLFVSGGASGGTYSFVMRRGTDNATLTTAETGSIAANTTSGVLVVADGVDQIKADFTGTATGTF